MIGRYLGKNLSGCYTIVVSIGLLILVGFVYTLMGLTEDGGIEPGINASVKKVGRKHLNGFVRMECII